MATKKPDYEIQIIYDLNTDTIIIKYFEGDRFLNIPLSPEKFLDIIDECLLLRIKKIQMDKITEMATLIEKAKEFEQMLRDADNRNDIYRVNSMAKVVDRIRYCVKLLDMEERKIKTEMLERQAGLK